VAWIFTRELQSSPVTKTKTSSFSGKEKKGTQGGVGVGGIGNEERKIREERKEKRALKHAVVVFYFFFNEEVR